MKKILVVGGNGQLGSCIKKIHHIYKDCKFLFTTSQELDVTDYMSVRNTFEDFRPDFCINASAYTAVDLAESEPEQAYSVNVTGVANLADACKNYRATLIHISTDYVFDGESNIPYSEENFTNPQSVYGKTKLEGENVAMELNPKTVIIRTSWLYSEFGKNFVKTMLKLFSEREELSVVSDQFGQPTNANDLSEAIMKVIENEHPVYGVYHFSNFGEISWYDFAKEIAEITNSRIKLNAILTKDYPTPAKRPKKSTMNLSKIEKNLSVKPINWQESLNKTLKEIMKNSLV